MQSAQAMQQMWTPNLLRPGSWGVNNLAFGSLSLSCLFDLPLLLCNLLLTLKAALVLHHALHIFRSSKAPHVNQATHGASQQIHIVVDTFTRIVLLQCGGRPHIIWPPTLLYGHQPCYMAANPAIWLPTLLYDPDARATQMLAKQPYYNTPTNGQATTLP